MINKEAIELLEEARKKRPQDFIRDGTLYDGWKRYCGYLQSIIFQLPALLQSQPPASEFTKECRRKLSDSCCAIVEDFPGWRTTTAEARVMSFEACDRLDASEASRKELVVACEKLMKAWLPTETRSMRQLDTDMNLAYQAAIVAIAKANKQGKAGEERQENEQVESDRN